MKNKIKIIVDELLQCVRIMLEARKIWIYLPTIFAFTGTYIVFYCDAKYFLNKGPHENLALLLISTTALILSISALRFRNFTVAYLFILAINFLIRELDHNIINIPYYGAIEIRSKAYIWFALALIAVLGFLKTDSLVSFFRRYPFTKVMMIGTVFTYFMSQAVARRAFRGILPSEKQIHIILEEITENFAHVFFLLTAFVIFYYLQKTKKENISATP